MLILWSFIDLVCASIAYLRAFYPDISALTISTSSFFKSSFWYLEYSEANGCSTWVTDFESILGWLMGSRWSEPGLLF